MKKEKVFYGWYVVVGIILLMACNYGIINNCASLFFKPVAEDLGVSRTAFSMYYTIAGIVAMFFCPFVGKVMSKFGLKKTMLVSSIIGTIGLCGFSVASSLPHFYILGGLQGISLVFLTSVPASIIVNKWFVEKKGTALGIALLGGGLGGLIFSPIINYFIYNIGWRQTYFMIGILCLIITSVVVIFIMEESPEKKGLLPYGAKNNKEQITKKVNNEGETPFKKPVFWILCMSIVVYTISNVGIQMHIPSYFTDISFSSTFAAFIVTITLASAIPSKILIGYVMDKFGITFGLLSGGVVMLACQMVLKTATTELGAILFGVLYGYGTCLLLIGAPLIVAKLYGNNSYDTVVGVVSLFLTLAGAIGPIVSSTIYDKTGSYMMAWDMYMVLTFISIIILSFIVFKKTHVKQELSSQK